jgi:carbamoylphosphate synthase large subunit
MARLKEIAQKVAKAFKISGPYNMQIIRKAVPGEETTLKVIECNLRASRSFPFVSKVLGVNFIDIATAAIVGQDVPAPVDLMAEKRDYVAIKVPQCAFPFAFPYSPSATDPLALPYSLVDSSRRCRPLPRCRDGLHR